MSVKAEKVLEIARGEIGTKATDVKKCKYNTWFYGGVVSGSEFDWCAAFICWIFNAFGALDLIHGKNAGCGYMANAFKMKNELIYNKDYSPLAASKLKPGDIVFFHWSNEYSECCPGVYTCDHVGIVEKINADNTITTIEGNTGGTKNGEVMRRVHSMDVVSFAGRPKYATDSTTSTASTNSAKKVTASVSLVYLAASGYANNTDQVKTLQRLLKALGYKGKDGNTLSIDGAFGTNTDHAVRAYQKARKLDVDGVVGKDTWKSLLGGA